MNQIICIIWHKSINQSIKFEGKYNKNMCMFHFETTKKKHKFLSYHIIHIQQRHYHHSHSILWIQIFWAVRFVCFFFCWSNGVWGYEIFLSFFKLWHSDWQNRIIRIVYSVSVAFSSFLTESFILYIQIHTNAFVVHIFSYFYLT